MYRPLRCFKTTLEPTLCYTWMLNVSHYSPHGVSVMQGMFGSCTVIVDAHTLNLKNQYITLLLVHKVAAWTNKLQTILVIRMSTFRVVQLMYGPLQSFKTTLGPTMSYVWTLNVSHFAPHGVSVMQGRFRSGIVNVHARALNLMNHCLTLLVYKAAACTSTLLTLLVM